MSLLSARLPIFFIVFFKTVLGREHSTEVSEKFIEALIYEESP